LSGQRVLYHCRGTRSFRALWALEELGLDYQLVSLAFPPIFRDPDFLVHNPTGTVPLLVDGDVRLSESCAICDWLVRRYATGEQRAMAPAFGEPDYPAYLDALFFGEASLSWPQGVALLYSQFMPPEKRVPHVASDMRKRTLRLVAEVERRLGAQDFLVGNRFTMADISVGYAFAISDSIGLSDAIPPSVARYVARLRQRDAYLRAVAREQQN
jgi:glutathione S-transferase